MFPSKFGWALSRVRSLVIQEGLGLEPLLIHIKRRQRRKLRHLIRTPPGCLLGKVFPPCPTGRRPRVKPRTCRRDNVSAGLGINQCPLGCAGRRGQGGEVWAYLLKLLPLWPEPGYASENGWMELVHTNVQNQLQLMITLPQTVKDTEAVFGPEEWS